MAGELRPGEVLGSYRVGELLGKGGMGRVYRARQSGLEREVALKVLNLEAGFSPKQILRFEREMRVQARFSHPNLVKIYEASAAGELHYIAMELVEGESLFHRMTRGPSLTLRESLVVARSVLVALDHLHLHQVVHRDVKPGNVLLTAEGGVKLADFGLCLSLDAAGLTTAGMLLGTPRYFSPEMVTGSPCGPPADVYAVGVMLYELLAGHCPYREDEPPQLLRAIVGENPIPLSRWRPALPAVIEIFVTRLLAKDAADRPTAGGSVRVLDELLEMEGLDARDPGISPRPDDLTWGGTEDSTSLIAQEVGAAPGSTPVQGRIARSKLGVALVGALALIASWILSHRGASARTAATTSVSAPPLTGAGEHHWEREIAAVGRLLYRSLAAGDGGSAGAAPSGTGAGIPELGIVGVRSTVPAWVREVLSRFTKLMEEAARGGLRGPAWIQMHHVGEGVLEVARLHGGFEKGSSLEPALDLYEKALPPPGDDLYRRCLGESLSSEILLWRAYTIPRVLERMRTFHAVALRLEADPAGWGESPPGIAARLRFLHRSVDLWQEQNEGVILADVSEGESREMATLRLRSRRELVILAPRLLERRSALDPDVISFLAAPIVYHSAHLATRLEASDPIVPQALRVLAVAWPLADRGKLARFPDFLERAREVRAVDRRLGNPLGNFALEDEIDLLVATHRGSPGGSQP